MTVRPRRIAVLRGRRYWAKAPAPPGGWIEGTPPPAGRPAGKRVTDHVYDALRRLGHLPMHVVLEPAAAILAGLATTRASVFFNLVESYDGNVTHDMNVAGYLDLIGKPYTGSGPRAMHLGRDKAAAKAILRQRGVPTPDWATVEQGARWRRDLDFPLIVKPSRDDSSDGIDVGAVVADERALRRRIGYVHENFDGPALVERYIDGRELHAAIFGGDEPEALPLREIDFSGLRDGIPRIAGIEAKSWPGWWAERQVERPPKLRPLAVRRRRQVQRLAVAAYRALGLRDYGRVDFRLDAAGQPWILEVNPNPWIAPDAAYVRAWEATGRTFDGLIAALLDAAITRHRDRA